MSNIKDNLKLVKNQIHKSQTQNGFYIRDSVVWQWDCLFTLIMIVIMFPCWIREVKYTKVEA